MPIHLTRRHTPLSFRAIGDFFGRRDAATVRHAAAERIAADPALAATATITALSRSWPLRAGENTADTVV